MGEVGDAEVSTLGEDERYVLKNNKWSTHRGGRVRLELERNHEPNHKCGFAIRTSSRNNLDPDLEQRRR